mmetsp:Transcript_654/g.966  ORF Transcript_654/g.966 Transcript_654/m.966 type:complete len:553 (-) Transcript_654:170-1828(-)|eukprot:CAMPEP_0184499220 /NCGR_PEP_ID=MMETSP0113_2-20130426/40926_1 /TAXON_ID=91329 /ORGANISM="Norrisiella sphaerica, Strain BC52" /LENGTH=552 /DNA_ID=CAMNT_0026887055 /DNA_START=164 /DNA_END=1822 /DNA_ORIENTATION=-
MSRRQRHVNKWSNLKKNGSKHRAVGDFMKQVESKHLNTDSSPFRHKNLRQSHSKLPSRSNMNPIKETEFDLQESSGIHSSATKGRTGAKSSIPKLGTFAADARPSLLPAMHSRSDTNVSPIHSPGIKSASGSARVSPRASSRHSPDEVMPGSTGSHHFEPQPNYQPAKAMGKSEGSVKHGQAKSSSHLPPSKRTNLSNQVSNGRLENADTPPLPPLGSYHAASASFAPRSSSNYSNNNNYNSKSKKNSWVMRPTPQSQRTSAAPGDTSSWVAGGSKGGNTSGGSNLDGQHDTDVGTRASERDNKGAFAKIDGLERTRSRKQLSSVSGMESLQNESAEWAKPRSPGARSPNIRDSHISDLNQDQLIQRIRVLESRLLQVEEFKAEMERDVMKHRADMAQALNDRFKGLTEQVKSLTQTVHIQKTQLEKQEREVKLNAEKVQTLQSELRLQTASYNTKLKKLEMKIDSRAIFTGSSQARLGLGLWTDQLKNHFFSGILTITFIAFRVSDVVYSIFSGIVNFKNQTAKSNVRRNSALFQDESSVGGRGLEFDYKQ